jgi:hypothetical protein
MLERQVQTSIPHRFLLKFRGLGASRPSSKPAYKAASMVQRVEHLSSNFKAQISNPSSAKEKKIN